MVTQRAVAGYIAASFVATILFLADYANTYRAFYPAMVALANSSAFRLMTVNAVVATAMLLWFTMQFLFFGKLNASEETALLTSFTIYLAECIIVPLYFNLTLMSTTMVFFAFTLVWRLLHKLAAERVTTLSTVPLTLFPVTRMVAYLNFVLIGDVGLLVWLVQTRPDLKNEQASLHYSLALIYMLLVTSSLRSAVRFGSLFILRGQHTLLPFVADAITSIAESLLFVGVYAYIFMKSTLPLLLLRGFISHALRIFEKASGLAEFLMLARKVRHDMPDATAEDLARDARCTICYEDMVPGGGTKRLPCGHCYHTECLEHWLEGHSTCPYCRANIMRMRNGDNHHNENADENNNNNREGAAADAPAGNAGLNGPQQGEQQPPPQDLHDPQHQGMLGDIPFLQHPFVQELSEEERVRLQEQLEREANDPFAIRLRQFTAEHTATTTPEAAEEDLQAAYQRYLARVDPTNPALSPVEPTAPREDRSDVASAATAAAAAASGEGVSSSPLSPSLHSGGAASARAEVVAAGAAPVVVKPQQSESVTASPPSSPSPLSEAMPAATTGDSRALAADAAASASASASAAEGTTAPRSTKTVDQLKLKAYKRYHKRLREAEKELLVALKYAEESGSPA